MLLAVEMHQLNVGYTITEFNMLPVVVEVDPFMWVQALLIPLRYLGD